MEDEEIKIKSTYNTVDRDCPFCQNYPLEYEVFGDVREIFCSHCDYSETTTI